MESFIKTPNPEEAKKLIETIDKNEEFCIRIPYSPDAIVFASLLAKYSDRNFGISFSNNCKIELQTNSYGKSIKIDDKEIFIGNSSFSSLLPITVEDIIPIISGITSDCILTKRNYTEWELQVFNNMTNLGVKIEKNLKIPSYNELPLFLSLMESFDPYIPGITGNRENSIKAVTELGVNELVKLDELNEAQLNTLLFKITSSIMKINPKISRDDIITDRVFYLNYDSLELAFAIIYFLDTNGSKAIVNFALNPSLGDTFKEKIREKITKGFNVSIVEENKKYYIIDSNLDSPKLLQIILLQDQNIKKDKPIAIKKSDNKIYTSRFFVNTLEEGLIQIES
ncbi:single-stranded DNA exonuclease [Acidianus sulfidivorans JP7]|uniref:Single-stranded DNA exonuclease n=1 Tax=Acidianus sulfidivorans JP7 TaxID=619593 RepID=A0A2U9INR1_9CREN|nr:single-stranded DNA exonuclease [Acidianus sulfidivorans]AWR97653.1 single-stranded DNA exonuclease [Acidianus sulfidivorans JP7]